MNTLHKIATISIIAIVGIGVVTFLNLQQRNRMEANSTIGILQTISHPAFDRAREGFMHELSKQLKEKCTFIVQNAEGSMATAQAIAQSFHHNPNITTLVTLGTLATQAISSIEKQKPIIFCAVTDPTPLGIIKPTTNVCGASDAIDIPTSVQAITLLCPQTQRVALLFNPAEANSASLAHKMEEALKQTGIAPVRVGVNNEAEIPSAISIATRKADVLWIPTDNTLANAIGLIGRLAMKAKRPLFICDNLLVTNGVLASSGGIDYTECGRQAAQLAAKILQGNCHPSQLGVVNTPSKTIAIHEKTFFQLGMQIPDGCNAHIVWIK